MSSLWHIKTININTYCTSTNTLYPIAREDPHFPTFVIDEEFH